VGLRLSVVREGAVVAGKYRIEKVLGVGGITSTCKWRTPPSELPKQFSQGQPEVPGDFAQVHVADFFFEAIVGRDWEDPPFETDLPVGTR